MALWRTLTQKAEIENDTQEAGGYLSPLWATSQRDLRLEDRDSLIVPNLVIEGKIEGTGDVRILGRFKGEVSVKGDLTIEQEAHISGKVRAENIVIKGEVEGDIQAASRVELLESGGLIADLKASSLTVAAGSRMRGRVDFGADELGASEEVPIEENKSRL